MVFSMTLIIAAGKILFEFAHRGVIGLSIFEDSRVKVHSSTIECE